MSDLEDSYSSQAINDDPQKPIECEWEGRLSISYTNSREKSSLILTECESGWIRIGSPLGSDLAMTSVKMRFGRSIHFHPMFE